MQITQQRLEANQANAKKSTGPKDTSKTRLNGLVHGLASNTIILPWEDEAVFHKLLEDFCRRYKPADPIEEIIVREAAEAQWLLQRTRRLEANLFNMLCRQEHIDAEAKPGALHAGESEVVAFFHGAQHFDRYRRYETARLRAWERAFQRVEQMLGSRVSAPAVETYVEPPAVQCLPPEAEGDSVASLSLNPYAKHIPRVSGIRTDLTPPPIRSEIGA